MKKKILGIMLAICFIVPCIFMLTACNQNIDNSINLAGKTITADKETAYMHWEHFSYERSYVDFENGKLYKVELTLDEFIEEFTDDGVFTRMFNNQNLNTVQKVKEYLMEYATNEVLVQYPSFKFSEDASTVTKYLSSDVNFVNPQDTYTVQLEQFHARRVYSFYNESEKVAYVDCTNIIQYDNLTGFYPIRLNLSEFTDVMVTLKAEDGSTCQKPIYEAENWEYLNLSIFMEYKIVK